ncbi:MAG: hypothetical protein ACOYO1_19080 [Bacteroidales bacterium]
MSKTIYKKETKSFSKVSRDILHKYKLNTIEIGLMASLLGNNDSYEVHKAVEQRKSGLGRKSFHKAWMSLEQKRFIVRKQVYKNGKIDYQYTISCTPIPLDIRVIQDKTSKHNTVSSNPQAINCNQETINNAPQPQNSIQDIDNTIQSDNINTDNIELNNIDISNIDINNIDISNIDNSTNKYIDVPIGTLEQNSDFSSTEQTIDNKIEQDFIDDSDILSETTIVQNIPENNPPTGFPEKPVEDNITPSPLTTNNDISFSNFILNENITSVSDIDFNDTVFNKKTAMLSYWYNKIDPQLISEQNLVRFNQKENYSVIDHFFRLCSNDHVQPAKYLDIYINEIFDLISFLYDEFTVTNDNQKPHPIALAKQIYIVLKSDNKTIGKSWGIIEHRKPIQSN